MSENEETRREMEAGLFIFMSNILNAKAKNEEKETMKIAPLVAGVRGAGEQEPKHKKLGRRDSQRRKKKRMETTTTTQNEDQANINQNHMMQGEGVCMEHNAGMGIGMGGGCKDRQKNKITSIMR